MKYRNKELTRMQRWLRKYDSIDKSTCARYGYKYFKHQPRWRQVDKAIAKRHKSMEKKIAFQESIQKFFNEARGVE